MNPFRYLRDALIAFAVGGVMLLIYEGLPLGPVSIVTKIPIIGPGFEYVTQGEVARRTNKAVAAALEGYVKQVELTAAQAELAETKRQLEAGRKATAGFAELLKEAQARYAALEESNAKEDAEYEEKLAAEGRSCGLTADDLRFLMR